MHEAPSPPLDPLALPSARFVPAVATGHVFRGRGGRVGALEAYRAVYREGLTAAGPARTAPPTLARTLREPSPEGEVIKFVQRLDVPAEDPLADRFQHLETESVLIPMIGSRGIQTYTLCVSSQVGCAMGCTFCETAQMGLLRSLTPREIVSQWFAAVHALGVRPRNIVFMGMGEPMDNLDSVLDAIDILRDHNGAHVPPSQITISTVGRVDGIQRLARHIHQPGWHRLGLAVSLNASNDHARSSIMPINRRWDMRELQDAMLAWPRFAGNKICVEYVLIPGVNDSHDNARELADFLAPFKNKDGSKPRALLNLIPYNPRRNSPWPAPDEAHVDRFLAWLFDLGVFAKRRRTKGRNMMGACGQLGNEHVRRRQNVPLTVARG